MSRGPIAKEGKGQDWSWKTGSPEKRANMEVYLEWLLTPDEERKPRTKGGLADSLGVTLQTLRNYAKEPWLQRELVQRGRALNRVERAQSVLDSLFVQATDKDNPRSVAAAKVWLDWVNKQLEPGSDTDVSEMSDDELMGMLHELIQSEGA